MVRTWVLALVIGTTACGPIAYVNQVTRHASDSVEAARQAQADKYSPYWWTRATEYLHQARVKAAHSDFQGANRFGRLATEAGDKARDESIAAAARAPAKPAPSPDVAPAKEAL